MKIIINASDSHCGGGQVLLNDLLDAVSQRRDIDFFVFVDRRYDKLSYSADNIHFIEVSVPKRFFVDKKIGELVNKTDVVLNISDLPPLKKHECQVLQYLQNRYFIDDYSTSGLPLIVRLRLAFEKLAFKIYLKNADQLVVQNLVMKELLLKKGFKDDVIRILPFKNIEMIVESDIKKEKNSFIYVASDEPHKNHKNLILAWQLLKNEGINLRLYLIGIKKDTHLFKDLTNQISTHGLNVKIIPTLARNELFGYYRKVSALIYPSYFECFGLPIVEAMRFDLAVIASELDYVRDLLDPAETFDPKSARSISRAIKRFLKQKEQRNEVLTADEFINHIISSVENGDFQKD